MAAFVISLCIAQSEHHFTISAWIESVELPRLCGLLHVECGMWNRSMVVLAGLTISQHNTPPSVTVTFTVPTTTTLIGWLAISLHNFDARFWADSSSPWRGSAISMLGTNALQMQGLFSASNSRPISSCAVALCSGSPADRQCHHQQALGRSNPRQGVSLLIRQFRKWRVEGGARIKNMTSR